MIRLPRWMHRLYAWTFRYFWLPCHVCGTEFGGHEDVSPGVMTVHWIGGGSKPRLCPDCTATYDDTE